MIEPWMVVALVVLTIALVISLARDKAQQAQTTQTFALGPVPAPPQKPDVPPGMYTFGFVWRWDGVVWHLETPPSCEPITRLASAGETLWATGWNEVWTRRYGVWTRHAVPDRLYGLQVWSEQSVMAAGGKSIYALRDGGLVKVEHAPSGISDLWGPRPDDLWIVGWDGMILRFRDGAWFREESGVTSRICSVCGDARDVIAVGERSVVLRSSGDGHWTREEVPPAASEYGHGFDSVWADGAGAFYAVTSSGRIFARRKGRWAVEHETGRQLKAVWGSSPRDVYVVGLQGQLFRSKGDGVWRDESGARTNTLSAIHARGGEVYVGGDWFFEV